MITKKKAKVSTKKSPRKKPVPKSTTAEFEELIRTAPKQHYELRLYITGTTPRSCRAIENVRSLCDEHLAGRYDLEVIDIYQQPAEASGQQIIAAPTLIKNLPYPSKRMVGDLSNRDRVLIGLDLDGKKTSWLKV